MDGFNIKAATKLFDSILDGPMEKKESVMNKIKGQVLLPNMTETVRKVSPLFYTHILALNVTK